jgi:hypothetical protein
MRSGRDHSAAPAVASAMALAMVSSYMPFIATIQRIINTMARSVISSAVL